MSSETPYLGPQLGTTRARLAEELGRYGEDDLAVEMLSVPTETYRLVLARALNPTCPDPKAATIARGAVQALTGVARPTARLRARAGAELGALWEGAETTPEAQPTRREQA